MIVCLNVGILTGELFGMNFRKRSVNIDLTHRCTLECPKCLRQSFRAKGFKIPGSDMTMSNFIKLVEYFNAIIFCGQISDPIFHPKFIDFLKVCADNNKKTIINTAASHKKIEWYRKAFQTHPQAEWLFGIDGLPKDSNKYRKNQNGEHLYEVMKMCAKMGLKTRWQYIVFRYNENDIETCRKMAKDNNIHFDVIYSGRWQKKDSYKPRNPNHYLNSKKNLFDVNGTGDKLFEKGVKELEW